MVEEKRVDEEWKKRAHDDKIKASQQASNTEQVPNEMGIPEINFTNFISGLATQVLMALGQIPHPATGKKELNPEEAKYLIDTIQMLETKTRGNLTPDEAKTMKEMLYNLQMGYVAVTRQR